MDIFLFCLCLGFLGLIAIAIFGHGHHFAHHAGSHAAGSGHAAHSHSKTVTGNAFHGWLSPRVAFSLLFAFGATGTILHNLLPAFVVLVLALVAAWAFERWLVQPIWRLLFGFASSPARTLESTLLEEAEAVTNFDARGQGLVAVQLDGQLVQILGSLSPGDRQTGVRVRAGERLSITAVDAKRNSCTVSRLPLAAIPASAPAAR